MDRYKLYRPDRVSAGSRPNWVIRLVEVLAAIGFALILMVLFR